MNNKIEELAEQAGIKHRLDIPNEIWGYDKDLEKFAELIIKEAMEIVRDEVSFHSDLVCADNAIKKVNKHFGVDI